EAGAEIGVDHGVPHVAGEAGHGGVAGDAGVVDEDLDLAGFGMDLLDGGLAGLEAAGVELDDLDAGLGGEGMGGGVVGAVIRDHNAAGGLELAADLRADSACAAGDEGYPAHSVLPGCVTRSPASSLAGRLFLT